MHIRSSEVTLTKRVNGNRYYLSEIRILNSEVKHFAEIVFIL